MYKSISEAQFRKFAPIDREHSIFELTVGDKVLLDVSAGDGGAYEVAFHEDIVNKTIDWDTLLSWLNQGRSLVELEKRG